MSFVPSENRANRNRARSWPKELPATRSAITLPKPGPMPKPCPHMPVAITKPGSDATRSITGTTSGMVSIIPAQAALSLGRPSAGNAAANSSCTRASAAIFGCGFNTLIRSKGETSSPDQLRLVPQASG